jgi:hypothetical protein
MRTSSPRCTVGVTLPHPPFPTVGDTDQWNGRALSVAGMAVPLSIARAGQKAQHPAA